MLGVTDAVGEEERESCGEVVPIAMREAGDAPSDAEMSRFISSLLRRDTEKRDHEYKQSSHCGAHGGFMPNYS